MKRKFRTGSSPVSGTKLCLFVFIFYIFIYRGVEQLVARRAHNPEVVRFKSHPRYQRLSIVIAVESLLSFYFENNNFCRDTVVIHIKSLCDLRVIIEALI